MSDASGTHDDARRPEADEPFGAPMDRRRFLKAAGLSGAAIGAASLFGGIAGAAATPSTSGVRAAPDVSGDCIAVLGLGAGPVFYPDRNNTGFALFHNGGAYLVDAGAGTIDALMRLGVTLDTVRGLFFTHYHLDHTAGYADLLTRGSQMNAPGHELATLRAYGPSLPAAGGADGLEALTAGIEAAFGPGYELHFWARPYLGLPATVPAPRPSVTTAVITPNPPDRLAAIPVVSGDPDVRVEAVEVDHDEDLGTCYAYRFTLLDDGRPSGRSVVFSGDRAHYNSRRDFSPSSPYYAPGGPGAGATSGHFPEHPTNEEFQEAFQSFARDATVLVHEVARNDAAIRIASPDSPDPSVQALYWHLVDSHTDAGQVPQVARDARVGKLVLSHYGDYTQHPLKRARDGMLAAVRKANAAVGYRGRIVAPLEGDVLRF